MYKAGILSFERESKVNLYQIFEKNGNELMPIFNTDQLGEISVLILDIGNNEKVSLICKWLIEAKKIDKLFVWIISSKNLNKQLYLELGANGFLLEEEKEECLYLMIDNTLGYFQQYEFEASEVSNKSIKLIDANLAILVKGKEVNLTRLQFKIFKILYENKNKVVSYQDISQKVWESNRKYATTQIGNIIFQIRKKLESLDANCIQTVRCKGYRLVN